jgi:hypothetical protein
MDPGDEFDAGARRTGLVQHSPSLGRGEERQQGRAVARPAPSAVPGNLAQCIPDTIGAEARDGPEELRREVTAQFWRAYAAAPPRPGRTASGSCGARGAKPRSSGSLNRSVFDPWVTPVPSGNRWEGPGMIIDEDAP